VIKTFDVLRKPSRAQEIFETLQNEIVSNELKPGTPVDKMQLCARFRVSRTPVTDALNRLSETGLIDIFPQHGTFVSKINLNDVREYAFVRECIEIGVVRHLTGELTEAQLGQLSTNIRIQRTLAESGDTEGFYRYDKEFHDHLLLFSNQQKAAEVLRPVLIQLERVRKQIIPLMPRVEAALEEHRELLECLKGNDKLRTAEQMRRHLRNSMETVDLVLGENPDLLYQSSQTDSHQSNWGPETKT